MKELVKLVIRLCGNGFSLGVFASSFFAVLPTELLAIAWIIIIVNLLWAFIDMIRNYKGE